MLTEDTTQDTADRPDNQTKFLWFSGKGGTGKTTISASTALQLADRGHMVLLISTDPAHSLSDSLDMDIDGMTSVTTNLNALELDPEEEVETFRDELQLSQYEDQFDVMDDVHDGIDIMKSGPGIAEMAAFNRFIQYMNDDTYDVIVFDTAPTGHTLSLLELPEVMDSMVGKILTMRMRFSQAVDTFKSFFGQDTESPVGVEQLEELKQHIENARTMLTDPSVTSFNFVMLSEKMSIYETERAMENVNDFDIPVGRLFVNKLIPENPDCDFCTSRRTMQQDNLTLIHDRFTGCEIVEIPLMDHEIQGPERLNALAEQMVVSTAADTSDPSDTPS